MNAVVQITRHSMQQIAVANRLAEVHGDIEAQERQIASIKQAEAAAMVARLQTSVTVADKIADEILSKFGTDEMVAVIRACFANKPEVAAELIRAHADQAIWNLAELEAIKQAEDARYA